MTKPTRTCSVCGKPTSDFYKIPKSKKKEVQCNQCYEVQSLRADRDNSNITVSREYANLRRGTWRC